MITHFEATLTLLAAVLGMLGTLIALVWRARGWVDRLNTTDARLAQAIESLDRNQQQQHQENQRRFEAIERQLQRPRRGRGDAATGAPAR